MVFEEAARLSHQLGQRWTQASALTPKVPAQSQVLTLRRSDPSSPKPASEASPVPCLKEHMQYITALESEDYSLLITGKRLKGISFLIFKTGMKFENALIPTLHRP
jgi:hypothetical protein